MVMAKGTEKILGKSNHELYTKSQREGKIDKTPHFF